MKDLNAVGRRLLDGLTRAKQSDDDADKRLARADKVNIVGAGGALTAAYEQLRNAAENTEEHLLLKNAIRRFYKQLFITRDESLVRSSGNELAVELTFAGYVPNDSLTQSQLKEISKLATTHYEAYELLLKERSVSTDDAFNWMIDILSVGAARILRPHRRDDEMVDVAYHYYESVIPEKSIKTRQNNDDYGAAMFVAVHRALFKSDTATIRAMLCQRYGVSVAHLEQFVAYNKQIDTLLDAPVTKELYHLVDRQGAPLRIIRRLADSEPNIGSLLTKREAFLEAFEQQVQKEYSNIMTRVNRAIVRSVIFLIITKFLVGIAIEVPYDFWAHGEILWQPLLINLLFPPFYMILLRMTLNVPGYANTTALVSVVDTMLYGSGEQLMKQRVSERRYGSAFSALYILFSLAVFAGATWLLVLLGFSWVHIIIFFVFFSTASFLGFRLSRMIRELEITRSASSGLTLVRDFLYLPFVTVGRWMSDKYSQINVVTLVLDMLIELPLKTVLRLVRQWSAFIDDRKDRIS